ncbi:helix-turn-helix domain-containing protein [Nocardia vinacea]|uniref:helix-turn-helix domain-containing protein n=1 Tax=Nocardia vinacea TaxID=96468 RepID=UPI0002ED6BE4|nr:helix-turn-helix domain-containing protein [Nocardia vinacea]
MAIALADGDTPNADALRTQIANLPTQPASSVGRTPDLLTIPEACARLRLSRWGLYQLINNRELATVKIGRRRFVPLTEVQRFVDELTVVGGRS